MGEAELDSKTGTLIIRSVICIYGQAATPEIANQIVNAISKHWNEPEAFIVQGKRKWRVQFEITGFSEPQLAPEIVWYNDDPRNNYFRIEEYAVGNISFVDGIGCNTGYFKLDNLLQTSTTAAHEYGHTLGLVHPKVLDIRGGREPSIMYPRGTLCDPPLQYDPTAKAGEYGGFLDPRHRKVFESDIQLLKLHRLNFDENGRARVGEFSSLYHQKHS